MIRREKAPRWNSKWNPKLNLSRCIFCISAFTNFADGPRSANRSYRRKKSISSNRMKKGSSRINCQFRIFHSRSFEISISESSSLRLSFIQLTSLNLEIRTWQKSKWTRPQTFVPHSLNHQSANKTPATFSSQTAGVHEKNSTYFISFPIWFILLQTEIKNNLNELSMYAWTLLLGTCQLGHRSSCKSWVYSLHFVEPKQLRSWRWTGNHWVRGPGWRRPMWDGRLEQGHQLGTLGSWRISCQRWSYMGSKKS